MSGTKILLDTNIILYFLNGDETLADVLEEKDLYVSVISELELLSYKGISEQEIKQVKEFLALCLIVNLNEPIKEECVRIRKTFGNKLPDSIIAATSFVLDIPLISADIGFRRIDDLTFILYEG